MEGSSNTSFGNNGNGSNSTGDPASNPSYPPQSKFVVGPIAQAAADAARAEGGGYQGAPTWPPKDVPAPMQNTFFNPQSGQATPKPFSGYLPPQKPRMRIPFGKIFFWLVFFAIIAGGIMVFVKRDELFGSLWVRGIRTEQATFNTDMMRFENIFDKIDLALAQDEEATKKIEESLKQSKEYLLTAEKDVDDVLYTADKGAEGYSLSKKDRDAQAYYLTCATARKNAIELLSKGIVKEMSFIKANYAIMRFENETENFRDRRDKMAIALNTLDDDKAKIAATIEVQKSSMRLYNYLLEINQVLDASSISEEAEVHKNFATIYGDIAKAIETKDEKARTAAIAKVPAQLDLLNSYSRNTQNEKESYIEDFLAVNINPAMQSLGEIKPTCIKAERASEPEVDIAKIKGWFNM